MCNFYGYKVSKKQFIVLKDMEQELGLLPAMQALFNGFDYGDIPILLEENGKIVATTAHWEFIPPFVKNEEELQRYRKGIHPKTGAKGPIIPWLNAKAENLLINAYGKKSMWAEAALHRRCLIPMTHFFEWRDYKPEGEKKAKKYPYCIGFTNANAVYCAAGIWNEWTDESTGEIKKTVAIVTTAANSLMAQIHNSKQRQPSLLNAELAKDWLLKKLSPQEILHIACYQLPSSHFSAYPIAKDFKTADNPLQEFQYLELPAITD